MLRAGAVPVVQFFASNRWRANLLCVKMHETFDWQFYLFAHGVFFFVVPCLASVKTASVKCPRELGKVSRDQIRIAQRLVLHSMLKFPTKQAERRSVAEVSLASTARRARQVRPKWAELRRGQCVRGSRCSFLCFRPSTSYFVLRLKKHVKLHWLLRQSVLQLVPYRYVGTPVQKQRFLTAAQNMSAGSSVCSLELSA